MGCMYWAFEYKSKSDSITRGVEQLRCYAEWFDYVVLVSEKVLDHRKSEKYWELKNMGAGMWSYDPDIGRCLESHNPEIQRPARRNRGFVSRRFGAFERNDRRANLDQVQDFSISNQSRLSEYF